MRLVLSLSLFGLGVAGCYVSHELEDSAPELDSGALDGSRLDAFTDTRTDPEADAASRDAFREDAMCGDGTVPAAPSGCCEVDGQPCTRDCGSFVMFCNEGCCVYTGP